MTIISGGRNAKKYQFNFNVSYDFCKPTPVHHGNINQVNDLFNSQVRGNHCTSNSIAALIYSVTAIYVFNCKLETR